MSVVLEVRNVNKRFGQIVALDDISLELNAGEIVALLGDNGAGKSTLMNIMCGAMEASSGEVLVQGQAIHSPQHAQELGVGMVYQDLALAPHLTVAENMFLGRETMMPGIAGILQWVDRREMDRRASEEITRLGIRTLQDVRMPVQLLSGGQRQVAAIARALMWTKVTILLDEPTAALGPKQVSLVLDAIRSIAERGLSVCIIAHDIPHILQVADRLVILRRGKVVKSMQAKGRSVMDVVALMVGDESAIDV
ncbi:ATP-binding cassette domain-containing protein [Bradyrhizobium jicamae]|uniref:ATP-binding cassette domain-containing protein n=1 Tax=Bradyrhizobium jicamae TaxID=280332 RepID=UPI001BA8F110|nr:ATP-binding cassette domain-containing protein [Bradyrhizobium jicamae]MBR0936048.1 sugar ABC transporter ATP-binding protein [Bradyrhizobium jicamae]